MRLMDPERCKEYIKAKGETESAVKHMDSFTREVSSPLSMSYETKDGRTLSLSMVQSALYWPKFCQATERHDLEHDPRFDSHDNRLLNRSALVHILDKVFLSRTLEEWKTRLQGIPFGYVQTVGEVVNDPQAKANNYFVTVEHPQYGNLRVIANPLNFSETPATYRMPAPVFGQHTEEVLLEYGYSWEDIAQFKEKRVIA